MPAASGGFTPRLSAMASESRAQGSFGTSLSPSPPQAARPVSAGTPRAGLASSGLSLSARLAARPASARPSTTRPWSGKGKKPAPGTAGRAELARREKLPDSHPDKIFVPPPPELEVQWALSAVDAPLLGSLVTRYSGESGGARPPRSRDHNCAVCRWDEEARCNTIYVLDPAIAGEKAMHVFHLEENRWQLLDVRGQMPVLEHGCSATVVAEKIIVLGGQPAAQPGRRQSQVAQAPGTGGWVHIFDTLTGIWTQQLLPAAWSRKGHSATLVGSQIYIYGGELALAADKLSDAARAQSDLVLLNAVSMSVTEPETAGEAPPNRSYHSGALSQTLNPNPYTLTLKPEP